MTGVGNFLFIAWPSEVSLSHRIRPQALNILPWVPCSQGLFVPVMLRGWETTVRLPWISLRRWQKLRACGIFIVSLGRPIGPLDPVLVCLNLSGSLSNRIPVSLSLNVSASYLVSCGWCYLISCILSGAVGCQIHVGIWINWIWTRVFRRLGVDVVIVFLLLVQGRVRVLRSFEPSVSSTNIILYGADSVAPDMIASSIVLAALSIRASLSSLSLV